MFGTACRLAAGLALPACLAACLQAGQGPGPLAGPSTLALAIRLSAVPDVLPTDGTARSIVAVTAAGPDGAPARNLRLRVQIVEGSTRHDAGRLSARFVVTDAAGRAAVEYRAPLSSGGAAGEVDHGRVVTLAVTPVSDDFAQAVERRVRIRLVPAGDVIPPFEVRAGFEVTPVAPAVFDQVRFSAVDCPAGEPAAARCTHDPAGSIAAYRWDFGDGGAASGQQLAHVYSRAGTYFVRLTVVDSFDRSADATATVTVADEMQPEASFTVSPMPATAGAEVFLDASTSTAAPGRHIVAYTWNFGDGSTGDGVRTSHVYRVAGNYTVVLNVTDDRERRASAASTVEVTDAAPVAAATVAPPVPAAGRTVLFDAEESRVVPGRRIARDR